MLPLVSILIPAYNSQEWIGSTIQSALNQTWPRKEIIIVDDGSTDATFRVVQEFNSSALKVIKQENGGACRARNRALMEAQGEYIQWLDADDLLAEDKIMRQMKIAKTLDDPGILFTGPWGRFYHRISKTKFQPTPMWRDLDALDWLILRLSNPWIMPNSVWLVNRLLSEKAGPWNETLERNQDGEYFCRVVSFCRQVKFVPESKCFYRMVNCSSVSRSTSHRALESLCHSIDLEIHHVLAREDNDLTRAACINRLNLVSASLENCAPDLADRLRLRVVKLGGTVEPKHISRKHALTRLILGEKNTRDLKNTLSRGHQRISCSYDRWLAKMFRESI